MGRELSFRAIHAKTKHWFEDFRALEDYFPMNLEQVAVMQYIGRKDEEENNIYEGDIVRVIEQGYQLGFYYEDEFVGVVKYSNETCTFYLDLIKFERGGEPVPDEIDGIPIHHGDDDEITEYWFSDYIVPEDIKILGNIYENPELLEEST